jgi:hypothetical protein
MRVECEEFFGKSLFFVGEFGVNDYHLFFQKKMVEEAMSFVPHVVATISMAIEVLPALISQFIHGHRCAALNQCDVKYRG